MKSKFPGLFFAFLLRGVSVIVSWIVTEHILQKKSYKMMALCVEKDLPVRGMQTETTRTLRGHRGAAHDNRSVTKTQDAVFLKHRYWSSSFDKAFNRHLICI